jgi:hypothetical protein
LFLDAAFGKSRQECLSTTVGFPNTIEPFYVVQILGFPLVANRVQVEFFVNSQRTAYHDQAYQAQM